jgi:hypothetical protein
MDDGVLKAKVGLNEYILSAAISATRMVFPNISCPCSWFESSQWLTRKLSLRFSEVKLASLSSKTTHTPPTKFLSFYVHA